MAAPVSLKVDSTSVRAPQQSPASGPARPSRRWLFVLSAVVLLAVAAVAWYSLRGASKTTSGTAASPGIVFVGVTKGALVRSVRVGGTVQAVHYAAITAPQLRGDRGGGGDISFSSDNVGRGGGGGGGGRGGGGGGGGGTVSFGGGGGMGGGPQGGSNTLVKVIEAGTIVKKGDVLAEFDRSNAQNIYDTQVDAFNNQLAEIENRRAQMMANKEARLSQLLSARRSVEQSQLDNKKNEVLSAIDAEKNQQKLAETQATLKMVQETEKLRVLSDDAALKSQELQQERNRMLLDIQKANLEKLTVKAPIDGLVVLPPINRGATQGPAQEGDTIGGGAPFVQIIDSSEMIVRARVNQLDAAQLKIGGSVVVHLDAYPDVTLPGKVLTIAALAQNTGAAGKSKAFVATFSIDGADPRLFPDISANVDVVAEQAPNALLVPRGAVVLQAGSRDKGFVFARDARSGQVQPREVTLGVRSDTQWAVLSGVNEGEQVAAIPPANAMAMIGGRSGGAQQVGQAASPGDVRESRPLSLSLMQPLKHRPAGIEPRTPDAIVRAQRRSNA